jgi:hypothetical protein
MSRLSVKNETAMSADIYFLGGEIVKVDIIKCTIPASIAK